MKSMGAVFFLSEEDSSAPLMLEAVLFCPILSWMSEKLMAEGIGRFFVSVDTPYQEAARACFPEGAEVTVSNRQEDLLRFLECGGKVSVFPCAAAPLDGEESYAYTADASVLRESWGSGSGNAIAGAVPLAGYCALLHATELGALQMRARCAIVQRHLQNGVLILDPMSVYIDPRVKIAAGTLLLPGTILRGRSSIGSGCEIGPNSVVTDCRVGDGNVINASQLLDSTVGDRNKIGPFAYVRPGSAIGSDTKIGDFVEVKNSVIGDGTKISHLTYVGDSDIGRRVNFGCGTVTTNYDGFHKFRTTVEDDVFIGCNTNLVAPVRVGSGAYIAAGATITKDVPADSLAIARTKETIKDGWAAKRRRMKGEK